MRPLSTPRAASNATGTLLLVCLIVASSLLASVLPALAQDAKWTPSDRFTRDLTPERRANLYGFRLPPDYARQYRDHLKIYPTDKQSLPSNFSWVAQDAITSVKDQGECGSCWAFAAVAQIEAHMKIYYNKRLDLSEQQMIYCNPYGADCGGGWASAVYNVAMTYGCVSEYAIPYGGTNIGECTQSNYLTFANVANWNYVSNDVTQIKTALLEGPVCSAMAASGTFPDYGSGCFDGYGGDWTDHLVLIVGWDDRACGGVGGWICKNSWGVNFGQSGFFTIQYGASLIGTSVTQISVSVPPTTVTVTGPLADRDYFAGETVDVTWSTTGSSAATVDIWGSWNGVYDTLIASGVPNDGHYSWTLPNRATTRLELCVVADGDTHHGYGFSPERLNLIGHATRYVSAAGSAEAPYLTSATAAHTIAQAVGACTGRDTVLVAAGSYNESVAVPGSVTLVGGWSADFATRDTTPGATSMQGSSSALQFGSGADEYAGVVGFGFHDCVGTVASLPTLGRFGGAIYVNGGSPTIRECVFENNAANIGAAYGMGGAIFAIGGAPRVVDCAFSNNRATSGGAVALMTATDASLSGNTFLANACVDSTASNLGAALWISGGVASVDGDVYQGNHGCAEGAAIYATDADLTLTGASFAGNRAVTKGGGVSVHGGTLSLCGGGFTDNTAVSQGGGALYATGGAVTLRNAVLSGNTVSGLGAAVDLESTLASTVENLVFSGNTGVAGTGALFCLQPQQLRVRNSIFMDNASGGVGGASPDAVVDYNLFWNNGGGDIQGLTGGAGNVFADPLLCDVAQGDYALALHSPCLDRGDPDPACLDPDGSRNDIGVYGGAEAQPVAPAAVAGVQLTALAGNGAEISWTPNAEPDVTEYVVYRLTDPEAQPGPADVLGTVAHPDHVIQDPVGGASYLVVAVDAQGHVGGYSDLVGQAPTAAGDVAPRALAITAVVPNPFNPSTTVRFEVPATSHVRVTIHDMRGRLVRTLADAEMGAGRHVARWNGRDDRGETVATGVYLLRVDDGRAKRSAKLVLAK